MALDSANMNFFINLEQKQMNENKYIHDVFISYARHDGKIKDRIIRFTNMLKEEIKKRGKHDFSVFIDIEGIHFGDPFNPVIMEAIGNSNIFISLVTEFYLRSDFCQKEFNEFYNILDQDKRRKIIPILWNNNGIETCSETDFYKKLSELHRVDFVEPYPIRKEINKEPTPQVVTDAIGLLADRICEILDCYA